MQHNSFFPGCNYLNRDITTDARTGYRLYPVQDIDSVLTSGGHGSSDVNVDDTFSLLFGGICFRQLKETLKHTMLVHESVFESQIHELHRLYQRQKELMMEMEGTRQQHEEEALYLNSSVPSPTTHWMSSNVSVYHTRNFPCEQQHMPNQTEAVSDVKKPEKLVLDLELPVLECHDGEEETSLINGQVHEVANSLESGSKSNKLLFDLNEPAEIEEHYEFISPVSSVESDKKNEGEGSCWMYEAQGIGIDLNMFPLSSEEEVCIVKKLGAEKPQECVSEQSRALVQALPCLNSTLLMNKPHDSFKPRKRKKKVKLGPVNKTFKGSELDLHASAQDKGSSSSVRNQSKAVAKKKRKKSRRLCFVKERNHREISAAEAMVDISRKSDREASEFITSFLSKNLLLLAEVSSLAVGGYELDYSDATTEMNLEDRKTTLRSNAADNKTAVSSIILKKQKRSYVKGKRKDDQHTFSECEANEEDLQVKVDEVSDQEGDCEFFPKKKRRSSPLKRIEDLTWGARSKRRRGSRIPATDFQHMIINQIV
ncbi:Uncharacterized protein HA466_0268900 [Hirschfeldia incana]|nr:Uncharacterized protein HA466_0268900 [Hirschfeldia incana]KAJ0235302.1 Uncharacterized protein HA466_0268900 [Hirschfeldia incana]